MQNPDRVLIGGDDQNAIESLSNKKYGSNLKADVAMRVVSDHVRAVAFCICDGQIPGNSGPGYVIRRILRRAVRYGYTFLKMKDPFIYKLVDPLSEQFSDFFPEIAKNKELVKTIVKEEESSFLKTLSEGILRLDSITSNLKSNIVSGKVIFELYDTYGFPLDLTADILRGKDIKVDNVGFEREMEKSKTLARANWKGSGDKSVEERWFKIREEINQFQKATIYLDLCPHWSEEKVLEKLSKKKVKTSLTWFINLRAIVRILFSFTQQVLTRKLIRFFSTNCYLFMTTKSIFML